MNDKLVNSNVIKKYLHEILTNAIFNYSPCKDLLENFDAKQKPKIKKWGEDSQKWVILSAEPFHNVSKFCFKQFKIVVHSTHEFIFAGIIYRGRLIFILPSGFCKSY